jgi:hypothetical protein
MGLRIVIIELILLFAGANLAQAAAIANLTDLQQTVEIQTLDGYDAHVIEPGRTFSITGDVRVRYNGQDYRIESMMEYAIWPKGVFGPQKRLYRPNH